MRRFVCEEFVCHHLPRVEDDGGGSGEVDGPLEGANLTNGGDEGIILDHGGILNASIATLLH